MVISIHSSFAASRIRSLLDSTSNAQIKSATLFRLQSTWADRPMLRTRRYAGQVGVPMVWWTLTSLQLYLVCGKDLGFTAEVGPDRRYYARDVLSGQAAWRAGMRDGFRLMSFLFRPTTKRIQDKMVKWTGPSFEEITLFSNTKRSDIIAIKINFGNATPPWQRAGVWKDREEAINKKKVSNAHFDHAV